VTRSFGTSGGDHPGERGAEATARGEENATYRFILAEISLTNGDVESAVSQRREALLKYAYVEMYISTKRYL